MEEAAEQGSLKATYRQGEDLRMPCPKGDFEINIYEDSCELKADAGEVRDLDGAGIHSNGKRLLGVAYPRPAESKAQPAVPAPGMVNGMLETVQSAEAEPAKREVKRHARPAPLSPPPPAGQYFPRQPPPTEQDDSDPDLGFPYEKKHEDWPRDWMGRPIRRRRDPVVREWRYGLAENRLPDGTYDQRVIDEATFRDAIKGSGKFNGMADKDIDDVFKVMFNFFGYSDMILDNVLEPEEREIFYTLEDVEVGILKSPREETTLYDGREWRIFYWELDKTRMFQLADKYRESLLEKEKTAAVIREAQDVYHELPDEMWTRKEPDEELAVA